MKCSKENLSAYLDGELSEEEKHNIVKHLQICKNCAEEVKILSSLNNLIKEEEIEPSFEFNTKFWEKIRTQEDKKKTQFTWLPIPATAILLFIIFFQFTNLSYALLNHKDPVVKNIVLQQVKDTILSPNISNISSLINLCDGCIHNVCKCKGIECKCKQCAIHKKGKDMN